MLPIKTGFEFAVNPFSSLTAAGVYFRNMPSS
jgi:hypothetical protein